MDFCRATADAFYKMKIFLQHNSPPPSENRYGWMELPTRIAVKNSLLIEERTGFYGGPYKGSSGAPRTHGLCTMGAFSYSSSPLPAGLSVGRYCSISTGLKFLDSHHHTHLLTTSAITFRPHNELWRDLLQDQGGIFDPTWDIYGGKHFPEIGNDVWVGRDVTLSMGIKIGDGAIIAAGSTVTKDVPPYAIVGGNPATLLRMRFPLEVAARLQQTQWWNLDPKFIARFTVMRAEDALEQFEIARPDQSSFVPRSIVFSDGGFKIISP